MTTRIFITGGAGFIGSRLVKALLAADSTTRIWVYDNLHPQVHGQNTERPPLPEGVEFSLGDVACKSSLEKAVVEAQPDLVYHLAAETGTGQSYDEPSRYCSVNVLGTTNLIEALRKVGHVKRVVLAASRAVYGEGAYIDAHGNEYVGLARDSDRMASGDFTVPLSPTAKLPARPAPSHAGLAPAPASIYASTKLMQEYLLTQGGEGAAWTAAILRFQNVYGPGQSLNNPYTGVLSIFARQLLSGKRLAIFEDGQIARDFAFVDDVVNALVLSGGAAIPHGHVIDVGSGKAVSILEMAQLLMRELGVSTDSYEITGQYRIGDIRHACADLKNAATFLKWAPEVTIEEGAKRLAQWAKAEFDQAAG